MKLWRSSILITATKANYFLAHLIDEFVAAKYSNIYYNSLFNMALTLSARIDPLYTNRDTHADPPVPG
jgi:hypothetical protein